MINSFTMRVSLFLGSVSNYLYKKALTRYIARQQRLLDKDVTARSTDRQQQKRKKK